MVWYILPTQAREGKTFPRVVPRAKPEGQPEEKSDLPELGLEEYHSFEYRISDLNSQTVKSDRLSQRGTVNPERDGQTLLSLSRILFEFVKQNFLIWKIKFVM